MSSISQEIQALLKAPDTSLSQARLRKHLDETFAQFDDLDSLDSVCQRASEDNHRLRQQVREVTISASSTFLTAARYPARGLVFRCLTADSDSFFVRKCIFDLCQRALAHETCSGGSAVGSLRRVTTAYNREGQAGSHLAGRNGELT